MINVEDLSAFEDLRVLSYDDVPDLVENLKMKKKTVGLCHGTFDLLHPGHVKHLTSAKKMCDLLLVSVTCDEFAEKRKGSGRPVFSEVLRAYVLANIRCVDYSFISYERTAVNVIKSIKPSIYFKGPDYVAKRTAGIAMERKAVGEIGGIIKYTTDVKLSSSTIVEYIRESIPKEILFVVDRDGTIIAERSFLGTNDFWKDEVQINKDLIEFLRYFQSHYHTRIVVFSNQSGVAMRKFSEARVRKINKYLDSKLNSMGLNIDRWIYSPNVDTHYAKNKVGDFDSDYIMENSNRKPNPELLFSYLAEQKISLESFRLIVIIGDRHEDKELAENLRGFYIDSHGMSLDSAKNELDSLLY